MCPIYGSDRRLYDVVHHDQTVVMSTDRASPRRRVPGVRENEWSVWEKGPKHGLRAIHRLRRTADGEVEEEDYIERSFFVMLVGYPIAAVALWFGQASADGTIKVLLIALAVVLSLYAVYLLLMTLLLGLVTRGLRRLIDSL